eukprot:jgi/Bigna1/78046/fgenesh1_pg.52_\
MSFARNYPYPHPHPSAAALGRSNFESNAAALRVGGHGGEGPQQQQQQQQQPLFHRTGGGGTAADEQKQDDKAANANSAATPHVVHNHYFGVAPPSHATGREGGEGGGGRPAAPDRSDGAGAVHKDGSAKAKNEVNDDVKETEKLGRGPRRDVDASELRKWIGVYNSNGEEGGQSGEGKGEHAGMTLRDAYEKHTTGAIPRADEKHHQDNETTNNSLSGTINTRIGRVKPLAHREHVLFVIEPSDRSNSRSGGSGSGPSGCCTSRPQQHKKRGAAIKLTFRFVCVVLGLRYAPDKLKEIRSSRNKEPRLRSMFL